MGGKHRAPRESQVGPALIKVGTVVAMASTPVLLGGAVAEAAPSSDSILNAIASCESGGKNIPTGIVDRNGKRLSTAGGYFQIVNGTWKAHGGLKYAPTALGATYAEQLQVARNILNGGQGLGAWSESRSCWSKRIGKVTAPVLTPAVKITPKAIPKATSAPKLVKKQTTTSVKSTAKKVAATYVIHRGDTLVKIAATNGTTWRKLYELNRGTVSNPNRIYTGNHLRLR